MKRIKTDPLQAEAVLIELERAFPLCFSNGPYKKPLKKCILYKILAFSSFRTFLFRL